MKRATIIIVLALLLPVAATAGERGLLWRVVQTCVATHSLVGVVFPCLAVDVRAGVDRGYVIVRSPFETAHVVVSPTIRTAGIEADRLRAPDAPNYFAAAWASRRFVTDGLAHRPDRFDLALAVNSKFGRSQDQLHIHVDCVRQEIKRALAAQSHSIRPGSWTRVAVLPRAPRYLVTALEDPDLAGTNVFALVQNGLAVDADAMAEMTIVVVGADVGSRPGFYVLARHRVPNSRDEAHGEALMDHACSAFQ